MSPITIAVLTPAVHSAAYILAGVAGILAVISLIRPSPPLVPVAVLLLSVALFIALNA